MWERADMFLNHVEIRAALKAGEIRITPCDPQMLKQCSYSFRVGESYLSIPDDVQEIDLAQGAARLVKKGIPDDGLILAPADFIALESPAI